MIPRFLAWVTQAKPLGEDIFLLEVHAIHLKNQVAAQRQEGTPDITGLAQEDFSL